MDWRELLTVSLRGAHIAALLSLFGALVFRRLVYAGPAPGYETTLNRIVSISAWLALLCGAAWLTAVSAAIAGADDLMGLADAIPVVAADTNFGRTACVRLLLLAMILALLPFSGPRPRGVVIVLTGAAIAVQPLLGHAGALGGNTRTVLILIEAAHLLAAGAWLGGLLPLLTGVIRLPSSEGAVLCERFTAVGLVSVGTITVTALPMAGELIGSMPGLIGTAYGRTALVKLGLFFLALGLACFNRLVLTARLHRERRVLARRTLIGSIVTEAVAGLCVIIAAATLASLPPAVHEQPAWPFAWRPSLAAWDEPELRGELIALLVAAAAGLALITISLAVRRYRVVTAIAAALLIAPFLPSLDLLLVEAWPTSYVRSPTGFSVISIVRGQALFGQHCASCHEPEAGSGGAADLTASHLWDHADGDLFWWLMSGIASPEGTPRMPGFASQLSADDRWALIDFIRARNVGAQREAAGTWPPQIAAPAMPLVCHGIDAASVTDLRGRIVRVVTGEDPPSAAPGVTVIRLSRDRGTAPDPIAPCVAATPDAWDAWALLAGVAPERFAGYEAIIDGQGWVHCWLAPGVGPERVMAAIREAHDQPATAGYRPATAHQH